MRILFAIGLVSFCGCSSFRTSAIDRCEHDTLVVNPNHPMKGVPVSLRIPTHIEVKVIETTYWEKQDIPGEKPTLVPLSTCRPTRSVSHDVCYTEKIFLVDPMRLTAAGLQNYGFTFASQESGDKADAGKGYLKKVEYRVDDQTITESANLLSNALGLLSAYPTSANNATPNTSNLLATDRTLAYGRFDINACGIEEELAGFLDCHVNYPAAGVPICPKVCEPAQCR